MGIKTNPVQEPVAARTKESSRALPRACLSVGVATIIGFVFWFPLRHEEQAHIQQVTRVLTRSVQTDIIDELQERAAALVRLAEVLAIEPELPSASREAQAKLFMTHHPGCVGLAFVDANFTARWATSSGEDESFPHGISQIDGTLKQGLEHLASDARGGADALFTPHFRSRNGKPIRRLIVPVYRSKKLLGFLVTLIDEEKGFADILKDQANLGYGISVLEDNEEIYRTSGNTPENYREWGQDAEVSFPGARWRIRVWPEPDLLREIKSRLPQLALIVGALVGSLFVFTLDFARTAYLKSKLAGASQALKDSRERLLGIISSAMDAIITVDDDQRIVVFNRAAEEIFRCRSSEAIGQSLDNLIPERFRGAHRGHIQNFGRTGVSSRSMYFPGAVWGIRANGEEFPAEASISQTKTATETLYTVILRDISVRRLAEEELRFAREQLEIRVQERTAELRSANQKLEVEIEERKHGEKVLQELSGRLLQLKDEEQRHIARELHDSTAQLLASAAIDLERIQKLVLGGSRAEKLLGQTSRLVEQAIAEIRTVSYLLHPPILDTLGLEGALSWYAAGLSRRSNIQVKVRIQPSFGRLSHELELAVFRIVQEALTNIHRHSGSPSAEISVSKDSCLVEIQITDRGRGIPPEILKPAINTGAIVGVGIAGMRERVRQLGGHLEIDSGSSGTSIRATLPISNSDPLPGCNDSSIETGAA